MLFAVLLERLCCCWTWFEFCDVYFWTRSMRPSILCWLLNLRSIFYVRAYSYFGAPLPVPPPSDLSNLLVYIWDVFRGACCGGAYA